MAGVSMADGHYIRLYLAQRIACGIRAGIDQYNYFLALDAEAGVAVPGYFHIVILAIRC
jgi:hypothetical protein